jgi:hypothetical protein
MVDKGFTRRELLLSAVTIGSISLSGCSRISDSSGNGDNNGDTGEIDPPSQNEESPPSSQGTSEPNQLENNPQKVENPSTKEEHFRYIFQRFQIARYRVESSEQRYKSFESMISSRNFNQAGEQIDQFLSYVDEANRQIDQALSHAKEISTDYQMTGVIQDLETTKEVFSSLIDAAVHGEKALEDQSNQDSEGFRTNISESELDFTRYQNKIEELPEERSFANKLATSLEIEIEEYR